MEKISDLKIAWEDIPADLRTNFADTSLKTMMHELRSELFKNFQVKVQNESSEDAKNDILNQVRAIGCEQFPQLLTAMVTVTQRIIKAISLAAKHQQLPVSKGNKRQGETLDSSLTRDTKRNKVKQSGDSKLHPQQATKQSSQPAKTLPKQDAGGYCYCCENRHGNLPRILLYAPHSNKEDRPWRESTQGAFILES